MSPSVVGGAFSVEVSSLLTHLTIWFSGLGITVSQNRVPSGLERFSFFSSDTVTQSNLSIIDRVVFRVVLLQV